MSFFALKERFASDATSIALKEMLFGTLRSKDIMGAQIVHASDFRQAVSQMGIPMGHEIVEDVLMHCRISNADGSIDFSGLELELKQQRQQFNLRSEEAKKNKSQFKQTSSAFDSHNPFTTRALAQKSSVTEHQVKLLHQYRAEVVEIFREYAHHSSTPQEVISMLDAYGIKSHRRFELLIEENRQSDDLTFREFLTTLSAYDPSIKEVGAADRAAGRNLKEETNLDVRDAQKESGTERLFARPYRRTNHMSQKLQQDRSNHDGSLSFSGRQDNNFEDQNPSGDLALYKDSSKVNSVLQPDGNHHTQMLTHNKAQMIRGHTGEADPKIRYNVEMKMQREQVLAALRRLDANDITAADFERRLYEIGFEMSPATSKKISENLETGKLNWKKIVGMLDNEIFHKSALEDSVEPMDVEIVKQKVVQALKKIGGGSGLTTLTSIFHRIDEDGNGELSFNEFGKACQLFGLGDVLSVEELRLLFHAMDKSGDGGLDIKEFSVGMRGPTPGPRMKTIRNSFSMVDEMSEESVELTKLISAIDFSEHPDVLNGFRSPREVQTDFINFVVKNHTEEITEAFEVDYESFKEYWCNLSFSISTDEEFNNVLKAIMGLGDLNPKPALVQAKRTAERKGKEIASRAVQVHGDVVSWGQEPSAMEKDSMNCMRLTRRMQPEGGRDLRYSHSMQVVNLEKNDPMDNGPSGDSCGDEMRSVFNLGRIARKKATPGSETFLKWDLSKAANTKAKERAARQLKNKLHAQAQDAALGDDDHGEEKLAGMRSGLSQKREHTSKRGSVEAAIVRNFGGPSPFARDHDDDPEALAARAICMASRGRKTGSLEAKSSTRTLADVVKEKKESRGPKSLADLLGH